MIKTDQLFLKKMLFCMTLMMITAGLRSVPVWALESAVLNQKPVAFDMSWSWNYALDAVGNGWLAYYGVDGNSLYVRRPNGFEVELGATDRSRALSALDMITVGESASVMWRDKLPTKTLYLESVAGAGEPAKPLAVSGEESEALTRVQMINRDGITYLLWLGEKGDKEKGEPYHLYFRTLGKDGQTLSPVERVLPGIYPAWVAEQDRIAVFSWAKTEGKLGMFMRVFDRAQKTFGPPVRISDAPQLSPFFQAFESGGHWFLLWVGHHGDNNEQWLEGLSSMDKGQTWKPFEFEKLRGLDFSHLEAATDSHGHILIGVSGIRQASDGSKGKNDVYILRSADGGITWSEPFQPRAAELQGLFEARDPSIAFGSQPGAVMLIWEDWRNFRPNVYVRFSSDAGATWGEPLPLGDSPSAHLKLDFRNITAFAVSDRYQVIAKRRLSDAVKRSDLVRYEFKPEELQQQVVARAKEHPLGEKFSEAYLRERIEAFWKAQKQEDAATTYAMQDPFFRAVVGYKGYESNRGPIKYESYEILNVTRQGNLAKVLVKIEASVPEFMWRGKPYSQPRHAMEQTETWLFIDGDWFREYYDSVNNVRFTKY